MEEKVNFLEPLFERAEIYGNTSYELFKLKALDKTTDVLSSLASRGITILVIVMFITVTNIGVSLLLGEILGKLYYGFFCVAGFYGILTLALHFFMHDWVKKIAGNSIISQMLK